MTTVEIPEGSGNRYRYEYEEGSTVYKGPVGDSPQLTEGEFMAAMVGEITPRPEHSKNYDAIEKLDTREIKKSIDQSIKEKEEGILLLKEADTHLPKYQGKAPSRRMETSFQKHLDEKYPGKYKVQKERIAGMTYLNVYGQRPKGHGYASDWDWDDRAARFFIAYDSQEVMTPEGLTRGAYDHHRAFAKERRDPGSYHDENSYNYGLWLDARDIEELKRLKPIVGKAVKKYNAGAKSINAAQDILYSSHGRGVPWPLSKYFTDYKQKR